MVSVKCDRCGKELFRYRSLILKRVFCPGCRRVPVEQRFWSKVDKSRGPDACWPWTAYRNEDGYGVFPWGKEEKSHRVAWILTNGPIPKGKSILHQPEKCNHRWCCNPAHLYVGTQFDNVHDMIRIGTKIQPRGESSPNAVLTNAAVRAIRGLYNTVNASVLAERFGVKLCTIRDVAKGRSWKHVDAPVSERDGRGEANVRRK